MPKTWSTGELVTAADFNLLPRVLYREVLSAATLTVTIDDADILGTFADWETLKLTIQGNNNSTSVLQAVRLRLNADSSASYRWQWFRLQGDGVQEHRYEDVASEFRIGRVASNTNMQSFVEASILGHSRPDRRTSVLFRSLAAQNATAANVDTLTGGGWWDMSTVVTSLAVGPVGLDGFGAGTLVMVEGMMRREPS